MSELGTALSLPHRAHPDGSTSALTVAAGAGAIVPEPPLVAEASPRRPWYFSTTAIAIAYFVFSPLGSILILTDHRRSKKAKLRAVAVLLFSLSLLTYRLFFMPPTHF